MMISLIKFRKLVKKMDFLRNVSSSSVVQISEQKIRVGNFDINYVKSSVQGGNPQNTLICLPGALGKAASL